MCHHSFTCAMTHSYVPWLIHECHDSFICAMTHSYVPWLIHECHHSFTCAMTHSYVPWLIHECHHSFICAMTHSYVPRLIHECHHSFICAMTHSYDIMSHVAHIKICIVLQCVTVCCSVLQCVAACCLGLILIRMMYGVHETLRFLGLLPTTTCSHMLFAYVICICYLHVRHEFFVCAMTHSYVPWLEFVWYRGCAKRFDIWGCYLPRLEWMAAVIGSLKLLLLIPRCVAVCCSVLQCVAVCCSMLQCVVVWCSVLPRADGHYLAACFSVLQCVA